MPSCVFKGCTNYTKKVNKRNDISYHRFPTDPVKFKIWSRVIQRQRMEPFFKCRIDMRACSEHFREDDFHVTGTGLRRLKKTAVPSIKVQPFLAEAAEHWKVEMDTDIERELDECCSQGSSPEIKGENELKRETDESCSQGSSSEITREIEIKIEPYESCSEGSSPELKREIDIKIEPDENRSQGNSCEIERENGVEKETDKSCSQEDLNDVNINAEQSVFDSPKNIALERKLNRVVLREFAKTKKIKSLHDQNRRLKKRNESLVVIIKDLKKKFLRLTRVLDQATQLNPLNE